MGPKLRRVFEDGFVLPALGGASGPDHYPWLSLCESLYSRPDCHLRHGLFADFPGMQWRSLDILGCSLSGPAAERPVTHVSYDLSEAMALHDPAAFDELRARFDDALELEGDYAEFPHHGGPPSSSVRARSLYALDAVELNLSSIRAPRDSRDYTLSAILSLHPSLERLAAPYLDAFEGRSEPWSVGDQSARIVQELELPQLEAYRTLGARPVEPRSHLALYHPERRSPPQWLRERLAPHKLIHWSCAGYWGLATPDFTTLFEAAERPDFHLIRLTPARGSGEATLELRDARGSLWRTRPGPAGLDAVADHLRAIGSELLVSEIPDA